MKVVNKFCFAVKPRCEHCVNFLRILGGKYCEASFCIQLFTCDEYYNVFILLKRLIAEDEDAFDVLYCIAFAMMDAQWLATHASYMEFNVIFLTLSIHIR